MDADGEAPITQDQAERIVRQITRTCRGPYRTPMTGAAVAEALQAGEQEQAQAWDALRTGCGYDINTIILSQPLDGGDYLYCCPQCGLVGRYTAPRLTRA